MKKILIILGLCILLLNFTSASLTFLENFTDGDYTSNPTWTVESGTWDASSNYLTMTSGVDAWYYIKSTATSSLTDYQFNFMFQYPNTNSQFFVYFDGDSTEGSLRPKFGLRFKSNGDTDFDYVNSTGTFEVNDSSWSYDTNWHKVNVSRTNQGQINVSLDGNLLNTTEWSTNGGGNAVQIGVNCISCGGTAVRFDDIYWEELASPTVFDYGSVTLNQPSDNGQIDTTHYLFNTTYTPTNAFDLNMTNATISVWFDNGTLFFNETNTTVFKNSSTDIYYNISGFIVDDYVWNVQGCEKNTTHYNCTSASSNFSFSWLPFSVDAESHNSTALETSYETFKLNITTASGYTVSNARLVYNNTNYENAVSTSLGSGAYSLSQSINIPAGTTGFGQHNRTFYWNVTVTEETTGTSTHSSSSTYNQTIDELIFGLCGGTLNIGLVNFTLYDEENSTKIDSATYPTSFQATFNVGAYHNNKVKNYSINNQTVNRNFYDFCTNSTNYTFYTDMEALIGATSYTDKNYFLTNASLTNDTSDVSIYLLNSSNAIEFFIDVKQDLSPVKEAKVNIQKYFVGEGVYKTVEIDETSSDTGEFTAYLDLDKDYKFIISKNGEVLGTVTKTASCKEAPCELSLGLESASTGLYTQYYDQIAQNILYNLSYNPNTKIVTFEFLDTTGLANYFRMYVWKMNYNSTNLLVIDTSLYTSSGTITGNISNWTGDFKVEVYVSRSPEKLIDYLEIAVTELAGIFGILGLFFALLIILTIIFGLALNPVILTLSVPLSLTFIKIIGLISISWMPIVIFYALAGLAIWAMVK